MQPSRPGKTEGAIARWRKKIDAIDEQLLSLLNERANCSIEIGWIKRAANMEIYVPQREVQIVERMKVANRGPLRAEAVRRLFERIIDESRSTERIVCEGGEEPTPENDGRPAAGAGSKAAASPRRSGKAKRR